MDTESRHQCLIYEGSPSGQMPALAALIRQKLAENYRCLYLNSPPMVTDMRFFLSAAGVNVVDEVVETNLVLSSEPAVSSDGNFDVDLMIRKLEESIEQALDDGYKGLFATGDMTWEFGSKESYSKLLRYEWRLERLFHKRPELCGICQYHSDTLPREVMRKGLLSHTTLFINETLSRINQHYTQSESLAEEASANSELDGAIANLLKG